MLGFLLGVVLVAGVTVVRFLVSTTVYSAEELRRRSGLPTLGVLASSASKSAKGLDQYLNKLEKRPDGSNDAEMLELIAATVVSREPKAENILVTGDLPQERLEELKNALQHTAALQQKKVSAAESVLKSVAAVAQISDADVILLAADCTCSSYDSTLGQKDQIASLGKTVLGCVVFE